MSIKEFIQKEVILRRLGERESHGVLVVYDPARRYRDLCLELASDTRRVIDAGESSIEAREAAQSALLALGQSRATLKQLLVYVPVPPPRTNEERQRDPFALYAACGAVFPASDGDEYLALCLKARPGHGAAIRRVFDSNPNPDFAVIDAIGGGAGWPQLQTALGARSEREIILALLAPSDKQAAALGSADTWIGEARTLFQGALGLNLVTKLKDASAIRDELWRYLLISEFAFDLPGGLPPALASVPHAGDEAREFVEGLCETLRSSDSYKPRYIEQAERIERELNLPTLGGDITDLGARDTFPFEERATFAQAVDALERDNLDRLRGILAGRENSVWTGRGENQQQWQLLRAAAELMQTCADAAGQLPDNSRTPTALLDFYTGSLREADRRQREFEQLAADSFDGYAAPLIYRARAAYRKLTDQTQQPFIRHLEHSGWPPAGRLANADVFDRLVAPKLRESGRRTAFILVDALRYELGVELQRLLDGEGQTELQAACASLPTITPVGMASLLPDAGRDLALARQNDKIVPTLAGQPLATVSQRMDVLRARFGQRFAEMELRAFTRAEQKLPEAVELLVLRSYDMDKAFESNPDTAPKLISDTLKQVRAAVVKLRAAGFQDVVVATDHGFYLNPLLQPGDTCAKPPGQWVAVHDRLLLGNGQADAANFALPAEHLGIRGDFRQAAGPRSINAYRAEQTYFHGGASLQELVVPVLAVRLRPPAEESGRAPSVSLRYRGGATRITTRVPVIDVAVQSGDLFGFGAPIRVQLVVRDQAGQDVGEPRPGGPVDPATLELSLTSGSTTQITLRMELEFQGKFTVTALDPATSTTYDTLRLETDYLN
jgi:hypothetical protein